MLVYCRFILSLALTLGIIAPALADPPLEPASCKLRGAKRVTIGTFQFTTTALNAFEQQHSFAARPPGVQNSARSEYRRATLAEMIAVSNISPSNAQKARIPSQGGGKIIHPWCGIVDAWHYAALKAYTYCNSLSTGNGNAYFVVTAPSNFNDKDHHHDLYASYDEGLTGSCYVCSGTESIRTATPISRDLIKVPMPAKGD